MDYKDFTPRDKAFKKFINYRKQVIEAGEEDNFAEAFVDLCTKALGGDAVAQDCVAYFFNKGFDQDLKPNYEYYMSWQILAGANGNEFALEKLEFFLKNALDYILADEDLLRDALRNDNFTKDNAVAVIGNLVCEGIVDELNLNPKELIDTKKPKSLYSPAKSRVFISALERCLPRVIDYLRS